MLREVPPQDTQNMIGYIDALPEDLSKGWYFGHEWPLPEVPELYNIVICGMGGSAISGDMISAHTLSRTPIPIVSHRNYGLPAWAAGPNTLVICSSHSGNTEETLSAFETARAQDCTIMVLTTGGKLKQLADEAGLCCWWFDHVGQPRTAVAYTFGLLLALVERLGLLSGLHEEVMTTLDSLAAQRTNLTLTSPLAQNPARRLAGQLMERNIVIFASGELEVIARRWKTQINELAEAWASYEGLPEMNHNTLAGLTHPVSLFDRTSAIFLRAPMDHPRNALRVDASMQYFLQAGIAVDAVTAPDGFRLAQMWHLLQFGDYVSYYLALNYGVDPTPVDALVTLKKRLAEA